MIPPTPTPLPDITEAPITIPDMSLWDYAPLAINFWHRLDPYTVVLQALVILAIIVTVAFVLINRSNELE